MSGMVEEVQQAMKLLQEKAAAAAAAAEQKDGKLREREKLLEQERAAARRYEMGEVLELNVGGKLFTTLRSTMEKMEGSMFAALAGGMHEVARDRAGNIVIDRHPLYFELVLEYCRTGRVNKDVYQKITDRDALLCEVDYYGLDELRELLQPANPFAGSTVILNDDAFGGQLYQLVKDVVPTAYKPKMLHSFAASGWTSQAFHQAVDHKCNVLLIARTHQNVVFGGFWSQALTSRGSYLTDMLAFLFVVHGGVVHKVAQKTPGAANGLCDNGGCGPTFGGGHDFCLGNGNQNVQIRLGTSYNPHDALQACNGQQLTAAEAWLMAP
eukprot:TRINITY_DN70857_c0_g1_i1.p1 TRINITY_DN70857_c0_g1~~TRINITY_DN70857_c0_g1_i1.p1  ORF type:complete len:325 (+),score=95.78 TRINITY_DN70857_c0_g1_i1:91-1065(+)